MQLASLTLAFLTCFIWMELIQIHIMWTYMYSNFTAYIPKPWSSYIFTFMKQFCKLENQIYLRLLNISSSQLWPGLIYTTPNLKLTDPSCSSSRSKSFWMSAANISLGFFIVDASMPLKWVRICLTVSFWLAWYGNAIFCVPWNETKDNEEC